jgi:hypothetical protein
MGSFRRLYFVVHSLFVILGLFAAERVKAFFTPALRDFLVVSSAPIAVIEVETPVQEGRFLPPTKDGGEGGPPPEEEQLPLVTGLNTLSLIAAAIGVRAVSMSVEAPMRSRGKTPWLARALRSTLDVSDDSDTMEVLSAKTLAFSALLLLPWDNSSEMSICLTASLPTMQSGQNLWEQGATAECAEDATAAAAAEAEVDAPPPTEEAAMQEVEVDDEDEDVGSRMMLVLVRQN